MVLFLSNPCPSASGPKAVLHVLRAYVGLQGHIRVHTNTFGSKFWNNAWMSRVVLVLDQEGVKTNKNSDSNDPKSKICLRIQFSQTAP